MINKWVVVAGFLITLFFSGSAPASEASALSYQAFEDCRQKIMEFSDQDIQKLVPNKVIDSCKSFPISDDISIQILGAVIGPSFEYVLNVYSGLTGKEHGFENDDPLFLVATPLHRVLEALNYFFFGVFLVFVAMAALLQMFRLQKGEEGFDFREWFSKDVTGYFISGFLSLPLIGWMTPIQAIAVLVIVMFGYLAKLVIVYVFLAAFVGDLQSSIVDNIEFTVSKEMASSVIMHKCDIENRGRIVAALRNNIGSSLKADLIADPLYSCLVTSSVQPSFIQSSGMTSSSRTEAIFVPHSVYRTTVCTSKSARFDELQLELDDCGTAKFSMPPNLAGKGGTLAPPSILNAINLYANESIIQAQRSIAISMLEYECRSGDTDFEDVGEVGGCMIPVISGSGYDYTYRTNAISGEEELGFYLDPLTETSKKALVQEIKTKISEGIDGLTGNISAIRQHIQDILAPYENEPTLTATQQKSLDEMRSRLDDRGSLGFSEYDATFLVNNIKRGAWSASSLFFSGVDESVDESFIIEMIGGVYDVNSGAGTEDHFVNDPIIDMIQAYLLFRGAIDEDPLTEYVSLQGLAVPRVGLYMDSVECWFEQTACKRSPINPFSNLSAQGMTLINESLTRVIAYSTISKIASYMVQLELGPDGKPLNHNRHKFMVLDTLKDFSYIYFFIGLLFAIAIPLIPLLRILVMMVNWTYDVLKELIGLQIKMALSPMGDQGGSVFSDDVKESFSRVVALGLYFLFIIVGIGIMFLMFSFLYALNVFLFGALTSVISVSFEITAIEAMVIGMIFDIIIAFVLTYEVVKCSAYIERIPRAMAEHFGVQISSSESTASHAFLLLRRYVPSYFQNTVSSFTRSFGRK